MESRACQALSNKDRENRREKLEQSIPNKQKKIKNRDYSDFACMEIKEEEDDLYESDYNQKEVDDEFLDSSIHTDVQLFPNNFGLVRKTYNLPESTEASELLIKEFPSTPVHGSFWIDLSVGNILFDQKLDISRVYKTNEKTIAFVNINQVLKNNIGKKLILVIQNLNQKSNDDSSDRTYDIECKILSVSDSLIIAEMGNETRAIKSSQIIGFRGKEISFQSTSSTTETIERQSIGITQAGKGGTFTLIYLVKAAGQEISQNVVIDERSHAFNLTNKLTIQCLSKGLERVDSLKIVGASGMQTDANEFLFTGNNPKISQGTTEKVDLDKLMQFGISQTSFAKLQQEIDDLVLPKGEKQAVTLLENVQGKYEDVFCLDSKDVSSGKIPCIQKLKIFNSSDLSLMKGNVIVTDHEGLQVAQGCLDETDKASHGQIMLSQSFVVDCKQSTDIDKKFRETNNEIIYTQSVEFEVRSRVDGKIKVMLTHNLKGLILSNSLNPLRNQSQVLLGESNATNNLVWEFELSQKQSLTIKVVYEVNTEKKKKKEGSSSSNHSVDLVKIEKQKVEKLTDDQIIQQQLMNQQTDERLREELSLNEREDLNSMIRQIGDQRSRGNRWG